MSSFGETGLEAVAVKLIQCRDAIEMRNRNDGEETIP